MRRQNWTCAGLIGAAALTTGARGDLDVTIDGGDTVRGTLLPATERESFRFAVPEGARVAVALRSRTRGARLAVTLHRPDGTPLAGAAGRSARLRDVAAPESETLRAEVSGTDQVTTADYSISVRWRSARRFSGTVPLAGTTTGTLRFAADAGARVRLSVTSPRASSARPSLVRVEAADGSVTNLSPGSRGEFRAPATGTYTLTFENTSAAAGDVTARALVRPPRAISRTLAATSREIPAGTTVVVAAVMARGGGVLAAPGGSLAGVRVTVPEGALRRAEIVVLGTSPEVLPPDPESATRATLPAFVGPAGRTFAADARPHIEIPLSVAAPVEDDARLMLFADESAADAGEVPGADTDGTVVRFDAPVLTRFQGWYVVPPETPAPFVVETSSDRACGAAALGGGFAFVASPFSWNYLDGGAVGEGLVRVFERVGTTWIERAPLRSPIATDSDIFGASIAYRRGAAGAGDDSLLVAARDEDGPGTRGSGNPAIFEFTRSGGEWTFLRRLPDVTGYEIVADGDRLIVAPPGPVEFRRTAGGWTAGDVIPWTHGAPTGIALRGDTLLVGVQRADMGQGAATNGAAFRVTHGGGAWTEAARYDSGAAAGAGDRFAERVALGERYAAVSDVPGSPGVVVFRTSDGARDATLSAPVLPTFGGRSPILTGSYEFSGDDLAVAAGTRVSGWPFAGAYIYRRSGGAWSRVLTLDTAPALSAALKDQPRPSDIAFDGTTLVVSLNSYDSGTGGQRSAVAFFDLPPE